MYVTACVTMYGRKICQDEYPSKKMPERASESMSEHTLQQMPECFAQCMRGCTHAKHIGQTMIPDGCQSAGILEYSGGFQLHIPSKNRILKVPPLSTWRLQMKYSGSHPFSQTWKQGTRYIGPRGIQLRTLSMLARVLRPQHGPQLD